MGMSRLQALFRVELPLSTRVILAGIRISVIINIGTAMIASVSMGLTVDSTIHYITEFERARKTRTIRESLRAIGDC